MANQESNGNLRSPDYTAVNVSIGIPWTEDIVGVNLSFSYDRYQHFRLSLPGISVGKSIYGGFSANVTENWLLQKNTPDEQQLQNFLSGNSYNGSLGYGGIGATGTWVPGSGFSLGTGAGTDQIGVSWNNTPKSWNWDLSK